MDKLKPCPFCGSKEIQTHCKKRIGKPVEINGMRYWHVECLDCGSRTRNWFDDDAELYVCKDGKEAAIKAWNIRKYNDYGSTLDVEEYYKD